MIPAPFGGGGGGGGISSAASRLSLSLSHLESDLVKWCHFLVIIFAHF